MLVIRRTYSPRHFAATCGILFDSFHPSTACDSPVLRPALHSPAVTAIPSPRPLYDLQPVSRAHPSRSSLPARIVPPATTCDLLPFGFSLKGALLKFAYSILQTQSPLRFGYCSVLIKRNLQNMHTQRNPHNSSLNPSPSRGTFRQTACIYPEHRIPA